MKSALATVQIMATAIALVASADIGDGAGAWMLLVPAGKFATRDGRMFVAGSRTEMEAIVARTKSYHSTTEIVVDYDHQSVFGAKDGVGGTARAAGWVKELQVRDDGIWGRVEWTAAARSAIEAGEYRYLSPVIPHRKDGRILFILNAALTNTPALDLEAAAASAHLANLNLSDEGNDMEKILKALGLPESSGEDAVLSALNGLLANLAAIASALSLAAGATAADVLAAVNTAVADRAALATAAGKKAGDATADIVSGIQAALKANAPDPTQFVPISALDELRTELKDLKESSLSGKVTEVVDAAMKAGQLTPGQKDWALSYAKKDLDGFQKWLEGAPVLSISQMKAPKRDPNAPAMLDDAQKAACKALGITEEDFRKQLAADEARKEND